MQVVAKKPLLLTDTPLHYCPGCTHGIVHRLVAEVLEELNMTQNVIGVMPVGCAVFGYNYFKCDMLQAAHGRAPAVATAVKRVHPNNIVFSYQGDGDLSSIGMAETVHSASRGENITIVFINNGIYGMTGGQMAPTTMVGVKATTCPMGRDPKMHGNPIKVSEMLATLTGPAYIERTACNNPANVRKTKAAIKKALEYQQAKKGFTMVEILATCPTNYHLTALEAQEFVTKRAMEFYPLGVYKDIDAKEGK
jgi:2-oxoglutarate ferredoxin oxidoreductase subunit beta